MYYIYLLKNELGKIYYGSTKDLKKRFQEHNDGKSFATKGHSWKLVYYEAYLTEKDARLREKALKSHGWALAKLKQRISASLNKS